ncbi:MAG: Crp/Fnr family transcriptional regulator [bacterium]
MLLKEEEKSQIRRILKRIPLFNALPDTHLQQLIDDFTLRSTRKGAAVFYQTDNSTDLYIILKGKVRVSLLSDEGSEFVLSDLCEGDFFGELSLIDGQPRSATVIAEKDSLFGVLRREKFLSAVRQNPEMAVDLMQSLVQIIRKATALEESLAFRAVIDRVTDLFLDIARSEGERLKDGSYKIKKRTHKEIAERIGSSREAVSKILKTLLSKKYIIEKDTFFLITPVLAERRSDVQG